MIVEKEKNGEDGKKERTFLVSYVVECQPSAGRKTVTNRFGNQFFVSDKLNMTAYENIRERLAKKFEGDGRVTVLSISELEN